MIKSNFLLYRNVMVSCNVSSRWAQLVFWQDEKDRLWPLENTRLFSLWSLHSRQLSLTLSFLLLCWTVRLS